MPIEIRELVIRATVQDETVPAAGSALDGEVSEEALAQIIGECVRQVLLILAEKEDR